jgi:hypothetical protein
MPSIQDVPVDAGNDGTEDLETTQDICIAATAAPGANIAVWFTTYTQNGWTDLLGQVGLPKAGQPTCAVLSSSFYVSNGDDTTGLADSGVTTGWVTAVDMALQDLAIQGVTVCICSGDQGSDCTISDGNAHVTFPASDPWALGVGGTTVGDIAGSSFDEYVWNDTFTVTGFNPSGATGGGVSDFFGLPSYQSSAGVPVSVNESKRVGRGVPDVAGNASPNSGYPLNIGNATAQGLKNPVPMSGTSASTPLWAGLITVINAAFGQNLGFVNPLLYKIAPTGFRNIVGPPGPANNAFGAAPGYPAVAGWSACCGWGSPVGVDLLNALAAQVFTQDMQFWVDDSTFGADEVADTPSYDNAFWLVLEGFTPNVLGISATNSAGTVAPTLSGPFLTLLGSSNIALAGPPVLELPTSFFTPQRIRYPYNITFPAGVPFPVTGEQPYLLNASITVPGNPTPYTAATLFELVAGANPYFANVNPSQNNVFWLSQDLRVVTGTPSLASVPPPVSGPGAPSYTAADDSVAGAYAYIQNVISYLNNQIGYLNTGYTPPTTSDPLDTYLADQGAALTADSSVTPTTKSGETSYNNYNFAIARVRLKGPSGMAGEAPNTKVFFRLFGTQTNDTDYVNTAAAVSLADPFITYPSAPAASPDDPQSPLPGTDASGNINGSSLPFFATANYDDSPSDYGPGGVNNQTIVIPSGNDYAWAFYGCFLNVYDTTNVYGSQDVQGWLKGGTHHCLVAQIAASDAPIENADGVIENPENCDKLAQRNLQVTPSGNPSYPATHRVPQTLDLRPSPSTVFKPAGYLTDLPDELMFDWGDVPVGAVAQLYWPAAEASDVLALASKFYNTRLLSAVDAHTIRIPVEGGVGYVPIPTGSGPNFAGLLTLELPKGVRVRDAFTVVVRRITSRQISPGFNAAATGPAAAQRIPNWRYVVGTFQIDIPVETDAAILPSEENLLSILKWRLGRTAAGDRWRPVLVRYIEVVEARVLGLGGDPWKIPPSQWGTGGKPGKYHGGPPPAERESTGKVNGIYDRFGDFEGFLLLTEEGHERSFRSREQEIERLAYRAWVERMVISVFAEAKDPRWPTSIVLRRAPRGIEI